MQITELILKNFGKFTDKDIQLTDGINLIYGENESGKSTIHTFLKGMLFGLERGRGRAAQNDTFSRYEPWVNSGYYAGTIRFRCAERNFRMDRSFGRNSKSTLLFCEDDGEELSPEHGDLEMLLDKMQESDYENTISIRQMMAETTPALAAELKNYAANYYAAGNSEIDLEGALDELKERRKELEKEMRAGEKSRQEKRDKIEAEASYVWRDLRRLENEIQQAEEEWKSGHDEWEAREKARCRELEKEAEQGKFDGWRIHPLEAVSMTATFILSFILFHRPWNFLVAIVVALAEGLYIWNCLKDGRKKKKVIERQPDEESLLLVERIEKIKWKLDKLREDYQEKQVEYDNLQEQLGDLDEMSSTMVGYENKKMALELASKRLTELSEEMRNRLSRKLNERISEIVRTLTNGKYEKVWVDERLHVNLSSSGSRVMMEQVSRGTIEQIYFALRMAAAEVLYEEEFPVILDDTFVYYDDIRLEAVLEWLAANRRQVILFTCQRREEEILRKNHIEYHKIVLR